MFLNRELLCSGVLITSFSLLSGCVTTPSLTPDQCQANDWQEIGYEDGVAGRSAAYFGKHTDNCAPVAGSKPNRVVWEQGRQEGLKKFCTELSAYQLGRSGGSWRPICPLDNIDKLEYTYSQGRYYYLRQRDMNYLAHLYFEPYHRPPFAPTLFDFR